MNSELIINPTKYYIINLPAKAAQKARATTNFIFTRVCTVIFRSDCPFSPRPSLFNWESKGQHMITSWDNVTKIVQNLTISILKCHNITCDSRDTRIF